MTTLTEKKNKGITALETVVYIGILTIISVIVIQTSISIVRTHRIVKFKQSLEASGSISMERMIREIRNASQVDIDDSVLGSSPGSLTLTGTEENGTPYTLLFDVSGNTLRLTKDGGSPGNLTEPNITVSSLVFRRLVNSVSEGVRVELSLTGSNGTDTRTLDLFGFTVIRNSY